ncbi:group III truncated hemoglobin [Kordia sp.]|uniref:group III truncated hemoglobin n=1 Tax=Kordia sp. TaxID=1965332 RepID=UPI0025BA2768|nr:group III truncated hemoglobin [Kordia sp.]MCH2194790.1 group III truncated hemoglobin [Kordia sp.]
MKNDILNRADVYTLVTTFYTKIRKDDVLGPIFNNRIHDWDSHLDHLTDFWESSLFFVNKYKGNPLEKHVEVDAAIDHVINEHHFGIWLNYWIQTLDELFEGDKANIAKNRARKMGTFIYIKLFESRTTK